MRSIVTFEGIDEAIENLHYTNKSTLKYKLINAIRDQYKTRGEVASLKEIDTDFLVMYLWDTGDDPSVIRNRRKNFNSIKSTVNADLKKLYEEGNNSEGIIINPKNVFDMSDEAKSEMLETFSYGEDGSNQMPLSKIADVLNVINDFISNKENSLENDDKFEQLKEIIREISGKVGITFDALGNNAEIQKQYSLGEGGTEIISEGKGDSGELQFINDTSVNDEQDFEYEYEEIPEDEIEEEFVDEPEDDEYEIIDVEDGTDDDVEEILEEDGEEGIDETEVEELEEIPDEELEEISEDDIDEELIEEPEDIDLEEVEVADAPEDEFDEIIEADGEEEIDNSEIEELEEISEDEIEELVEEPEDIELEEVEVEDAPEDEFDEIIEEDGDEGIDDAEVKELEEVPDEEFEEVPEDEIEEELVEEPEDIELEEVEVEDGLEDEFDEILEEDGEDGIDDAELEELEEVPDEELEEILEDDIEEELVEEPEDVELEEVELEDVPEDEYDEILEEGGIDDAELEELEEVPDEELEEIPEDDIEEELVEEPVDDYEDIEIVEVPADEDDGLEEIEDIPDGQYDDTLEEILDDYDTSGYISEEGRQKALLLADKFDKMLSETERYYNRYLLIPGGEYVSGHANPNSNEKKKRNIQLPDFYFGKFPVTNHLFELFVDKTGYVTTAERTGYGIVYKGRYRNITDEKSGRKTIEWCSSLESENVEAACWFRPDGPGSSLHGKRNHPVVQVSLEDAMAFAAWTGKRLPTEEEWEAASRTTKGLDYPWGNIMKEGMCNIEITAIGATTPVDEFEEAANRFGVYDLIGNVMEWTGSNDGASDKRIFVTKGGSWVSGENIRLTQRVLLEAKTSSNILGFRCIAYQ